jgi:sulfur relay (sulfurtransferase) DsrF/TusC family protein
MPTKVLFIVNSDPRTSPRPAEAIRIAAGVGAWKRVEVSMALCESAVLALSEFPDELVDEDNFVRYLPIFRDFGRPIYVETGAPLLEDLGETPVPYERITISQLAAMAAASDCVLRF